MGFSFELYFEDHVKSPKVTLSKAEAEKLWNDLENLGKIKNKAITKELLYDLLRNGDNVWMNYPKFYFKRQIASEMCYLVIDNADIRAQIQRNLRNFTIKDFYSFIDYKTISFNSVGDMVNHIIKVGMQKSEELKKQNKRHGKYSYEFILAFALLFWEGYSVEDFIKILYDGESFYYKKYENKIRFSEKFTEVVLRKIVVSDYRYSENGHKLPIVHDGTIFGETITPRIIRNMLRAFNSFSEREVSQTTVSRTKLFCEIRSGTYGKQISAPEKNEYDIWTNTFFSGR